VLHATAAVAQLAADIAGNFGDLLHDPGEHSDAIAQQAAVGGIVNVGLRLCCGARSSASRGFARGYTLQFSRGTGPANEPIANLGTGRLPWGKDHHRCYRTLLYHRLQVGIACEDLPEEHNRVTLDLVLKDGHGIPAAKIDYAIGENTRRMMEQGIARATEVLTVAGVMLVS
jgi:hypothetical protein